LCGTTEPLSVSRTQLPPFVSKHQGSFEMYT
jgi:hypothetical protein